MSDTKKHSTMTMLLLSINGMVGSAWLFGAFYTSKIAGPAAILSWIIGATIISLIGFCFAEVSSSFPVNGGTSRLPFITHGKTASFVTTWVAWISSVTMPAIETMATLQYADAYFPKLMHIKNGIATLSHTGVMWAAVLMLILMVLNCMHSTTLGKAHRAFSSIKIFLLVMVIFGFAWNAHNWQNLGLTNIHSFMPYGFHGVFSAIATGGIAFAFIGFRHSIELAAETKRPGVAIPIAVLGSLTVCLILYGLLQIVFSIAIPSHMLQHGWSNLLLADDAGPLIGLAKMLSLQWLVVIILINACLAPMGAGLTYMTSSSRLTKAMSRQHQFPSFLGKSNNSNIPIIALIFNFCVGMMLFLPFNGWQSMVSFLVSAIVIAYSIAPVCLMSLRLQLPEHPRKFSLKFPRLTSYLAFTTCALLSFWTGWHNMKMLCIAVAIGLVYYFLFQKFSGDSEHPINLKSAIWVICYITGLAIISYLGSIGGGRDIIKFGYDIIVLAIFSAFIFYLAVVTRLKNVSAEQFITQNQNEKDVFNL
jgi:amino acid transporter